MAVSTTFKQPCPSCEAMVTIKDAQVGRKVECHKCKDKFVAEEPIQKKTGVKKDSGMTRKTTTMQKKVDTRVTAKAPAPGKNGKKAPVVDDEIEEVDIDEEDDDRPQTKSKGKSGTNGKSKPDTNITAKGKSSAGKSKRPVVEEEEDVEADEDEKPGKKKKKPGGSNKMTIGLGLAGVGVVVLCVAAYFVLRGPNTPTPPVKPFTPVVAKNNNNVAPLPPPVENKPDPPPDGKPPVKPPVVKPPRPSAGVLTDAEVAKLSNLLPNDAEHVFHVNFKELLGPTSGLRDAAFQSPGALLDAEIHGKIGFSPLLIDDVMRAERHTKPWSYTVLHFKEVVAEDDVAAALKLAAVGAPIDGKVYYRLGEPNPWFDSLARFSFGIPNQFAQFSNSAIDRPAFIHFYNSQTMIVADEEPLVQLLKAKRQFPLLTPRGGAQPPPEEKPVGSSGNDRRYFVPPTGRKPEFVSAFVNDQGVVQPPVGGGGGGGDSAIKFDNTTWEGKENKDGKIQFKFAGAGGVTVDSAKSNLTGAPGQWKAKGKNGLEITFMTTPGLSYEVTVDVAGKMTGMGKDMTGTWSVELEKPGGTPTPTPTPMPTPTNREDMFLTIKPSLKAIMDRMETRVPGANILFSSATDMDASRVTTNLPELRDRIVRRPRQFWDVTLMIAEATPRIRMLGTTLVQRDNARFQYRNELTCGLEIDAKFIHQELNERTANQIARFVMKLVGHEIRVPQGAEVTAIGAQPPDDKKPGDATASQITLKQEANTVDFTLDLVLDDGARTQIHGVTSLTAAALRVEMEAAAAASMRHALAWAAKTMGEKGLSDREIPEGKLPPGAFKRLDAPLRPDREPKNRISWMAALLPYMGYGNLYKTMQFDQSWRDPGNWRAGRTVIPQFLDPTYPDASRYVAFGALPVDFGATHYVGIAGVGPDAGSYDRRDPAVGHKRGVLGYNESATLDEIRLARGTSNSILMIQVPHDGITGVSPWIAGGGATLRGVEEKDSIAPFVLTTDKNGKPIYHQKKRGTYAVMTDGTVRFIGASVSDDVFKAMCTIGGNVPQDFDLPTNPNTPAIPPPTRKPVDKTPVVEKKIVQKEP